MRWVLLCVFAGMFLVAYLCAPPANFPSGSVVRLARGASASDIAELLGEQNIIAHPQVLRTFLRLTGGSARIQAGSYLFNAPENLLAIALRLVTGAYGLPPVHITFPEGETVRDTAERVHNAFPDIPATDFISLAQSYEGYLFPDTYLFAPSSDAALIVKAMRANFDAKVAPLLSDVRASGHSLSDIITMASLVEKEARTSLVRHIVAGILWNRLKLGMPLQVDAVFGYIYGRDTYSPLLTDLKVDSPYNTYIHTGLPPGPIDNPGLDSIDAALHPTKTDYLYYLTDTNGVMHYATTFAGHQANQQKYLH